MKPKNKFLSKLGAAAWKVLEIILVIACVILVTLAMILPRLECYEKVQNGELPWWSIILN